MLTAALLLGALVVGSMLGLAAPASGGPAAALVDPLILVLLTLLLVGLRSGAPGVLRHAPRTVLVACALNFLLVPLVAVAAAWALLPDGALRAGVLLYCLFPCTDWFLGFTRLAGGNTAVGAALIPLNLAIQLALFPVHLYLVTGVWSAAPGQDAWLGMLGFLAIPLAAAATVRLLARATRRTRAVVGAADALVPAVLAVLVASLFVAHVGTVTDDPGAVLRVLVAVSCFLAAMALLSHLAAGKARLSAPDRTLVMMTTSARNAPLVLGLTVVALPDQPLVHATIVLGMLLEFPHLTALQHLLRRRTTTSASVPVAAAALT